MQLSSAAHSPHTRPPAPTLLTWTSASTTPLFSEQPEEDHETLSPPVPSLPRTLHGSQLTVVARFCGISTSLAHSCLRAFALAALGLGHCFPDAHGPLLFLLHPLCPPAHFSALSPLLMRPPAQDSCLACLMLCPQHLKLRLGLSKQLLNGPGGWMYAQMGGWEAG